MLAEVLRTSRLTLRPVRASDVDDVLAYASDPAWSRFLVALPTTYARADAEAYVAGAVQLDRNVHASWGIEHEGHVVGGIDVSFLHGHRIGELGYGLAPRLWGQGLVVEAARAVVATAFTAYPHLVRIRATTDARNTQSLRVMDKLGMKREGLLRSNRWFRGELVDEIVSGVLRSEWGG